MTSGVPNSQHKRDKEVVDFFELPTAEAWPVPALTMWMSRFLIPLRAFLVRRRTNSGFNESIAPFHNLLSWTRTRFSRRSVLDVPVSDSSPTLNDS